MNTPSSLASVACSTFSPDYFESHLLTVCMHLQSIGRLNGLLNLQCFDTQVRTAAYNLFKESSKRELEIMTKCYIEAIATKMFFGRLLVSRVSGTWTIYCRHDAFFSSYKFRSPGSSEELEFLRCLGVSENLFWQLEDFEFILLPQTVFPLSFLTNSCKDVIYNSNKDQFTQPASKSLQLTALPKAV
ncbi:MAG: hypothetical protein U0103_12610 [Candidatus Obscuribacterales bacterium]|nr:MAG: hypothetical protein EKK48_28875 [Candidatus Melainabacteria bacterium]